MGTEMLSAVTVDQAVVAVIDVNEGIKLARTLENKGFGRVALAVHPRDTARIARDASVHVVLVCLARGDEEEAELLRTLKQSSEAPRVIAVAEFDRLRHEMEQALEEKHRPDRLLVKPLPTAKLVHEIEQQLRLRSAKDRLPDDAPLFAEVLAAVWREQRTGMLRVMAGGMQTVVYLRGGRPLFAEGGTPADMLGRIFVESGRITEEQLSQAVELMTSRLSVDSEQLQLGGALVELGFINPSELFEILTMQVRRKLLRCFGWRRVRAEFREGEEHLEGITDFNHRVPALLVEGMAGVPADETARFLERCALQYPRPAGAGREIEQTFGLGGRDRRLLDAADGKRSVRELVAAAPAGPGRTEQLLAALLLGQGLVLAEHPGATGAEDKGARPSIYGSARRTPGDTLGEEEEPEEGWQRVRSLFRKTDD